METIFLELLKDREDTADGGSRVRERLIALRQKLRDGEDPEVLKELMGREGNPFA